MSASNTGKWLKVILPPTVLLAAIALAALLMALKPEQERRKPVAVYPKIEVYEVESDNEAIVVESQGTVQPRRATQLTGRVSGQIEWVSPSFYDGGFFDEGEVLVKLDPLPYRSALAEARSRLALAESTWLQEKEAARQARRDWESVGTGEPSPLVLRKPQIAKAEADLEAARVAVEVAERNLAYTEIRAPYRGRVEAKFVELGQAVTAQATPLGSIYATDAMEVPVPISLDEAAWLNLPTASNVSAPAQLHEDLPVLLTKEIAGEAHEWQGVLDRVSASINPQSRMLQLIIRVEAPYMSDRGVALKPGMFVKAKASGAHMAGTVRIPRSALHQGDRVYRLTEDNRLEGKDVQIVHTGPEWAVALGLEVADRLCVTPLLFFVEGMQVEPVPQDSAGMQENGSAQ